MTVQQSKYVDNKTVTIKPLAYYKMLVHVLRFGNKMRDRRQYREVMGILIGRLEGEPDNKGVRDVIVEDYVPISHGGSIEVAFKPEDYVTFSYVDAEYAEREPPLFSVGWAHSHPGLKIFFSSTDVKNQLGWQTPNPSAIGIVFDHTYLENPEDLGFRTFRLDDPNKGPMSAYHEVKTTVEPPDNLEYYIKIMEIINNIHAKEPPILEINETPDLFGDILMPGQSQIMQKQPELELTEFMNALQNGLSKFIELSFEPLIRFFNNWSQNIIKKLVENNLIMRGDLIGLRDNISSGINNIQNVFKSSLTNKLYDLDDYFENILEDFGKSQETIKILIDQMKNDLTSKINTIFEEKINPIIEKLLKTLDKNTETIINIEQNGKKNSENLELQLNSLDGLFQKVSNIKSIAIQKVKESQDNVKNKLSEKIEHISKIFTELSKQANDFSSELDTAISILESSKNTIEAKLKKQEEGGVQ
ncbi:MAG: hypothetical protein ACTSPD_05845 [Promethearchaeota archaeon]